MRMNEFFTMETVEKALIALGLLIIVAIAVCLLRLLLFITFSIGSSQHEEDAFMQSCLKSQQTYECMELWSIHKKNKNRR